MVPKFRGDSDDWLDSDDSKSRSARPHASGKARKAAAVTHLPEEQANATVAEVFPNQCRVHTDSGEELLCSYRRSSVIGGAVDGVRERSPVAVGDRVLVAATDSRSGTIEGVCARRNFLARPAPGRLEANVRHILAANVDTLVVVTSVVEPVFSPGLVDRYLVAASAAGIEPLICVTKIDLLPEGQEKVWAPYVALGYPVIEVSSKRGDGIEAVRERVAGKTALFSGQSGVGKTSLLRALLGRDFGRVGEISQATGKGRHTTTSAVLLSHGGTGWIDTPGVREFGLAGVEPARLAEHFPEMHALPCEQTGCRHRDEPGCAARGLPRYASYRRILESLLAGEF